MAEYREGKLYLKCTECIYGNVTIEQEINHSNLCNCNRNIAANLITKSEALKVTSCRHAELKPHIEDKWYRDTYGIHTK